jgi:hypothetical protein
MLPDSGRRFVALFSKMMCENSPCSPSFESPILVNYKGAKQKGPAETGPFGSK